MSQPILGKRQDLGLALQGPQVDSAQQDSARAGCPKAFARALKANGLKIEGDPACSFTETHQVLLRTARAKGEMISDLLESNNIITNPQALHGDLSFAAASGIRMGTQEMTRHGMQEADFKEFAGLLSRIVQTGDEKPRGHFKAAVKAFRARFAEMHYCL